MPANTVEPKEVSTTSGYAKFVPSVGMRVARPLLKPVDGGFHRSCAVGGRTARAFVTRSIWSARRSGVRLPGSADLHRRAVADHRLQPRYGSQSMIAESTVRTIAPAQPHEPLYGSARWSRSY